MNSVIYRDTGKFDALGQPIREAIPMCHTNGRSIFRGGNRDNGMDVRLNAAGDTADAATGYQIAMDTLTYIRKRVIEQKFYEFDINALLPVAVGEGAFAQSILTNRAYSNGATFESGNIRTGASSSRLVSAETSIDGKTVAVNNWALGVEYSLIDVEQALVANNWDIVFQKHQARKKVWDLGIQQIALLGGKNDTNVEGLLSNTQVNVNTTFITKYINSTSAAEFNTFVQGLIGLYFANTNSTVLPTRFVIPMQDFLGFGTLTPGTAGSFPVSMITYLEDAFKRICGPDFKIVPNAYADKAVNNKLTGLNKNVYMLYRHDADSVRMDIPVDFTVTQPNTVNNFTFQDVAYGQYTGAVFYRQLEALMFTF